ncbi:MAG TPA: family 78 glycoside hydrolase catalytic domain [Clostridiales bacterium]|nr:family 78 glycoside hydrolase catalytic domain [Clostridiales bacterium]
MNELKFIHMKTEYFIDPIGIDVLNPVLSWNVSTDENSWEQEAYQILVADSEDFTDEAALAWDSGKVMGREMKAFYQGDQLRSNTRYFWKIRVWKAGENKPSEYSRTGSWQMGLLQAGQWKGKWIGVLGDTTSNPVYRRSFSHTKAIKQAFAYISGLGHHELYINGKKVSDHILEPGWTDYKKTCFYCTYDITKMLQKAELPQGIEMAQRTGMSQGSEMNQRTDMLRKTDISQEAGPQQNDYQHIFGVMLGDGMYHVEAGQGGRYVYYPRSYGRMKFIFQAEIEYEDGTRDTVISDRNWMTKPGPITFSSMYGGEDYDARLEIPGWCSPEGEKLEGWEKAEEVAAPSGKLCSQKNPPLKVMKTIEPISVMETKKGVLLYDLGENFSGFIKIRVKGEPGQTIRITPGELLDKDKEPDQTVTGKDYYWKYTIGSRGEEIWEPRFSYYGFRYVQVKAEDGDLPEILGLEGRYIYPDMELAGEFSCSNDLFNKIHKLITNAMLSNIKSVLTDCPHREKFGWLEQSHLIGPALLGNYDLRNIYTKILEDIRDAQHDNGLVPDIAPEYAVFGYHSGYIDSPEWGSAAVINPWYLYKKYGDSSFIKNNYDVMKKYTDYLTSRTHHRVLHHGLGDWCDLGVRAPFTQNTPIPLVATPIYYIDLDIMSRSAALLGLKEDEGYYGNLMEEVKKEFNLQFYDDQTAHYGTGSQAAQALALMAGLVEEDQTGRVAEELAANIRANQNGTTAGDVGHPYVMAALTKFGCSHVVNDMMNVTDRPGYGYQVACGATTLTEEWDGPFPEKPHGSQNHFMLGSGDEWFYTGLAGIRSIRSDYGADTIEIIPYFAEGVDWVKAWQMHPYGRVSVEWRREKEGIVLDIVIPPNAKSQIELPAEDSSSRIKVGSGRHHFHIKYNNRVS